jgi:hypothetical protein
MSSGLQPAEPSLLEKGFSPGHSATPTTFHNISFRIQTGETPMNTPKKSGFGIDDWWPILVIAFGLTFISILAFFHPHH